MIYEIGAFIAGVVFLVLAYKMGHIVGYGKHTAEHEKFIPLAGRNLRVGDRVEGHLVLDMAKGQVRSGVVLTMRCIDGIPTYITWRYGVTRGELELISPRVHDHLTEAIHEFTNRALSSRLRVA